MLEKEWQWFEEISRGRDCSMGLTSLKWSEMNAYFRLRGITPQQWQIDLIMAFDSIWVDVMGDDTQEISIF
ncbi:hypothetical protein KRX19_05545 [Cardiobacteriaceae bacterium TAE3-ERU3]|nr:hypothetical protein [Cardiobacteriaceae bacterium TAE3-ERU3]